MADKANPSVVSTAKIPAFAPLPPQSAPAPPTRYSIENLVLFADLIARVTLIEVREHIVQSGDVYVAEMEFEFEVLEYLKGGNGNSRIFGMVQLPYAIGASEEEARVEAAPYWDWRETRWDDVEAIIFMGNSVPEMPSTHRPNYYYLGRFFNDVESYSVAAGRSWLPLAPGDGATGTSNGARFLLHHPDGHAYLKYKSKEDDPRHPAYNPGAAGASDTSNVVALRKLKEVIALGDATLQQMSEATATANWWWMTEPRNLNVSATNYSVTLNWNEARIPSEVSGYRLLRRKQSDPKFIHLADVDSTVMEDWEPTPTNIRYEDTNSLEPGTTYVYRVLSRSPKYGGGTADGGKAEVTITTLALDVTLTVSPTVVTATPTPEPANIPESTATPTVTPEPAETATPMSAAPPAPQNLTATATHDSVTLSWDAPANASTLTGHRIFRREPADAAFVSLADISADATSYTDTESIAPATRYIYRVRAFAEDGSAADARVAITTAAAPESTPTPTPTPEDGPTGAIDTPTVAPEPTNTPMP